MNDQLQDGQAVTNGIATPSTQRSDGGGGQDDAPNCRKTVECLNEAMGMFRESLVQLQNALHGDSKTLSGQYVLTKLQSVNDQVERILKAHADHDDRLQQLEAWRLKAKLAMTPLFDDWRQRDPKAYEEWKRLQSKEDH